MTSLYQRNHSEEMLTQGDLLFGIPIMKMGVKDPYNLPDFSTESLSYNQNIKVIRKNLIILTQACDLVTEVERNRKPQEMVVCGTIRRIDTYSKNLVMETNKGQRPGYYLLHKEKGKLDDSFIIDFHDLHTIPYDYLNAFYVKQDVKIRPVSPYLEKISHHFGNFFSRIGVEYERDKVDLKQEYDALKGE